MIFIWHGFKMESNRVTRACPIGVVRAHRRMICFHTQEAIAFLPGALLFTIGKPCIDSTVQGEFQMSVASLFKKILPIAAAISALWLSSFFSAGSASAKDLLQCRGSTKSSVISCCQRETAGKRPIWMTSNNLTCSSVVACGGPMTNRERCRVEVLVIQNDKGDTKSKGRSVSDLRLKTNIHRVGTTVLNLPLYSFEYRYKSGTYIGVMAQDVLKVEPSAVSVGSDGFYRVDYKRLGIEMLQVQ